MTFSACVRMANRAPPNRADGTALSGDTLPTLLARVLLAFAIEFERDSGLSLASSGNVLRLVGDDGTRLRDLPRSSGVSKEAIAMAVGRLEERGFAVIEAESTGRRVKMLRLTAKGRQAKAAYHQFTRAIEQRWQTGFGKNTIASLRGALEPLAGETSAQPSPLFRALEPYSDEWRAAVSKPETLPHYPIGPASRWIPGRQLSRVNGRECTSRHRSEPRADQN
jgi:DNA-binding MarR family transcriptional regulator